MKVLRIQLCGAVHAPGALIGNVFLGCQPPAALLMLRRGLNPQVWDMHALLKAGMDSGEVAPLPWTVYGREQCQDAFRFLASGAGCIKSVLSACTALLLRGPSARSRLISRLCGR